MKFQKFISITIILTFACIPLLYSSGAAGQPHRPNINKKFSQEKEAKIQAIKSLNKKEAFDGLKDVEFLLNKDLTYKAIYTAFNNRRAGAIAQAQNCLKLDLTKVVDGQRIKHYRSFIIAKKIFEVFPDEATPILTTLYKSGDEITRGNIIRASGGVSGGQPIEDLLINALDDKSFAEEEIPEMLGEPMRVCDIAYNELVLRYSIRGVLRTICPAHNIETRDYHINKLKVLL